jgi:hypothetical protein
MLLAVETALEGWRNTAASLNEAANPRSTSTAAADAKRSLPSAR